MEVRGTWLLPDFTAELHHCYCYVAKEDEDRREERCCPCHSHYTGKGKSSSPPDVRYCRRNKGAAAPLDCHTDRTDDRALPLKKKRLVRRLLYLMATGQDITYNVQQLSQFVDALIDKHLVATHDYDWASCVETRRFVIGYCLFFGSALVSWKSNK
nr:Copia protein [Ipomoea batatas]